MKKEAKAAQMARIEAAKRLIKEFNPPPPEKAQPQKPKGRIRRMVEPLHVDVVIPIVR